MPKKKPHPHVEPEENFVSVAAVASKGRDALLEQLRAHMKRAEVKAEAPVVTPPLSAQTLREMEGGRLAVQRHEEKARLMRQTREPPDTVPAFRPDDYVPNFEQGKNLSSKTIK